MQLIKEEDYTLTEGDKHLISSLIAFQTWLVPKVAADLFAFLYM